MPKFQFCPVCSHPLEIKWLDNQDRLVCTNPVCSFVHYDNPTPVVAALIEHEGQILLARAVNWPPDWFGLITGFLEKNEHPAEAVLREVKEETNLDGKVIELIGLYTFKQMNQIIMAYHVQTQGIITLNEELAEYKLVPPAQVEPWAFGTGKAVADWLAKKGYRL
ncbi:MAG TPA: ADP-ribose pyrophosphatase [Microscillaceae bacterium]|jgi:NAD+ diphosphatase|nr:ADP-ribose pyrophosphatase [Microscillaceae bacterium]